MIKQFLDVTYFKCSGKPLGIQTYTLCNFTYIELTIKEVVVLVGIRSKYHDETQQIYKMPVNTTERDKSETRS